MIYTLSNDTLSVYVNFRPHVIHDTHPNWQMLMEIIRGERPEPSDDELVSLLNVRIGLERALATTERVSVGDDGIYIEGRLAHNYMTGKIMDMVAKGLSVQPWLNFVDKLLDNPSKQVYDDLFAWMEAGKMPVTPDGNFLAYKKVNEDYRSFHASPDGTHLLHRIGESVEMPRREVDDRRERTCSTGLHFASYDYAANSYYSGRGRLLVLEVNPADVVSIPTDYGQQKGRAYRYKVVGELEDFQSDDLTGSDIDDRPVHLDNARIQPGMLVRCVSDVDGLTQGRVYRALRGTDDWGDDFIYVIDDYGDRNLGNLWNIVN